MIRSLAAWRVLRAQHSADDRADYATFTFLQIARKGEVLTSNGSILMADENKPDITALTVQLLSSFVSNNTVPSEGLAELIKTTRTALTADLEAPAAAAAEDYVPAVSVRKSLASPDHIISLIDGRPYKTLKRHLATHGLTPEQYRERYKLPKSYPLVAASYSDARRAVAQRLGLGRKSAAAPMAAAAPAATAAPAVKTKPSKAAAKPKSSPAAAEKADLSAPAAAKAAPRKRLSIASFKEEKPAASPATKVQGGAAGTSASQDEPSMAAKPKPSSAKAKPAAKEKAATKPKPAKANAKAAAPAAMDAKAPEPANASN